jgi:hypothetical protein
MAKGKGMKGKPPTPSGQATQEKDPKGRIGQHTGAGQAPLMKK